jgi:thymidylate kinase
MNNITQTSKNTETGFLKDFFSTLNQNHINYIVLRNYCQLPHSTGGSDLDILINKNQSEEFFQVLNKSISRFNGKIVSVIDSIVCPRYCILGNDDTAWGVMIDLHYDQVSYRGYTIISNKMIWNNTFSFKNICVLNKKTDAVIGLFKELLNNNKCSEKYYNDFVTYSLDNDFLHGIFEYPQRSEIVKALTDCRNFEYSREQVEKLAKLLDKEFPVKCKLYFQWFDKLKRLFKQPGFTIAFIGTDGSGKSTIIEAITPALSDAFHKAVYYEHMRPNYIPSIAQLFGKKSDFNKPVTNPHGSTPSGFMGSFIRWFYYLIDYTFGYYRKVLPKKAIRTCVWIFDRYYYDYLIDPLRSRMKLPHWVFKFGQLFIPEPDLIVCLGAEAEVIHLRKPELPLHEVERQVNKLKEFCEKHERAVWINTGKNVDESSQDTFEAILEVMARRFNDYNNL